MAKKPGSLPDAPISDMPALPDVAVLTEDAPTAPLATGQRRFHVRLKYSPEAIVTAKDGHEAQRKYMRAMGLRATVHPFQVDEIDGEGNVIDAATEPEFQPPPPPAGPVVID